MVKFFTEYEKYTEQTSEGAHGHTTQYVMLCMNCVRYNMLLDHGLQTNDVDLYIYALCYMLLVFWSTDRPN